MSISFFVSMSLMSLYILCFQGHFAHVETVDEVKAVIAKLYENRKIANAAHNMYAYRIKQAGGNVFLKLKGVFCIKDLEEPRLGI